MATALEMTFGRSADMDDHDANNGQIGAPVQRSRRNQNTITSILAIRPHSKLWQSPAPHAAAAWHVPQAHGRPKTSRHLLLLEEGAMESTILTRQTGLGTESM